MRRTVLLIIALALLVTACHKHDDDEVTVADRTVLVYMSGENDLYGYISGDLEQMKIGTRSMTGNNRLVVYVDEADSSRKPYLLHIVDGETEDSIAMGDDTPTSDPAILLNVMQHVISKYPANEYGLVLWGHADGWLIERDSVVSDVWTTPLAAPQKGPRRAYGRDTGNNYPSITGGTWMNIPSMARVLSMVPKLKFIFADCCNFQSLEVAYELRKVTDYIIGSPAEIPGEGAPYHTVVPALFQKETFWQSIVDNYYEQVLEGKYVPLSVIKTSEMEQLAAATRTALAATVPTIEDVYPDMTGLIHYYYHGAPYKFYDVNDFMLKFATPEVYATWKQSLDRAVIYKKMATRWMTNVYWGVYYDDFTVTEEKYGGVSMFVPQYYYQRIINSQIKQLGWYYVSGMADVGW